MHFYRNVKKLLSIFSNQNPKNRTFVTQNSYRKTTGFCVVGSEKFLKGSKFMFQYLRYPEIAYFFQKHELNMVHFREIAQHSSTFSLI
jgi:hypothetical protein